MKIQKRLRLKLFSQGERKCSVDPTASYCLVNWVLAFSPLLDCYIQTWNLGDDYKELDLTSTWLVTTPTLLLEMLIAHSTLAVLCSKMIITRMDMLAYTPVKFSYLETPAKIFSNPVRQNPSFHENIFNNAPFRWIHSGISNLFSDKLEHSELISRL